MLNVAVLLGIILTVSGYPNYRDRIPNGKNVPHPCKPNYIWKGVGHENVLGGGVRNPFGMDFAANNFVWDECICEYDSDLDGRTNGEELGDPNCEWRPGQPAPTTKGLSHPGVCEPMNSTKCQWQRELWDIDCSTPEYTCDELKEVPDLRNVTVHLDETPVPAEETTYICQGVELPDDGDYHIIGMEPAIDNLNVAHHIILYGCDDDVIDEAKESFSEPGKCGMNALLCSTMLSLWTVGYYGDCHPEEYGIRIGTHGFKYAVLEMHWNNPELISDYKDSSGLTLYYTPNRRTFDAATIFIGPSYLELAPGQSYVEADGHCTPECTDHIFDEPVFVSEITPHMHYMGRGMLVQHLRDGIVIETLVDVNDYNYDAPETIILDPHVKVMPGDEITVKCIFETTNTDEFVFFGEATSDEMCIAVVRYYPKQNNSADCFVQDGIGWCGIPVGTLESGMCYGSIEDLFNETLGEFAGFFGTLAASCDDTGRECLTGCESAIAEVRQHICLGEDVEHIVMAILQEYPDAWPFIKMMASCDERVIIGSDGHDGHGDHSSGSSFLCDDIVGGASGVTPPRAVVMILMTLVGSLAAFVV